MKKKEVALENVKDVYGKDFDELKKQSDKNVEEIARVVVNSSAYNKKPRSLVGFEKQLNNDMVRAGIVDNQIKEEIMTKIRKTELFRTIVNKKISDEQLLEIYEDALDAEKITVVDKEAIYQKDHKLRMMSADKVAKFKGIDGALEDEKTSDTNFQINIINPNEI